MPTTPPTIPTETEPDEPQAAVEGVQETSSAEAPLSFVPHDAAGQAPVAPVKIRTGRFGELNEHELIHLLDTIEDERARGRFRESIYISLFVWLAIAWVVFYGPKYLWHAPQLISPAEAFKKQEMTVLNAPVLPHRTVTPPKVDRNTLEKLRKMSPKPTPAAPSAPPPAPAPAAAQPAPPTPAPPVPATPQPVPRSSAPPVADAPLPQPKTAPTKPNFGTPGTAHDTLNDAIRGAARSHGTSDGDVGMSQTPKGAAAGGGLQVLSDMQGVDFSEYLKRLYRDTMRSWIPLLPEETDSPLFKKGETYIILTILPDGTIGNLKLEDSTHDEAIDRAAWGSIISQGKLQPLPSQFHGPNLILRFHYKVN